MGRWKLGPQGAYYDANDSGPDQASPEQIAQAQGQPASPSPGGYQHPSEDAPYQQGARPGYHWEWSGGFTGGRHEVPDDPKNPNTPPLLGRDVVQPNPGYGKMPVPFPQPPNSGWYQDPSRGRVIDPFMNLGPGGQAGIYPWVQGTPPLGYQPPTGGFSGYGGGGLFGSILRRVQPGGLQMLGPKMFT